MCVFLLQRNIGNERKHKMKYGIFFAYWENEWSVGYEKYIDKVSALGFDILEIGVAAFLDRYKTDAQLMQLKEYAAEKGVILTGGHGPGKEQNLSSGDPNVFANAKAFYTDILTKLKKMEIRFFGGGLYSYWPVDYSLPVNKLEDWKNSVKNMRKIAKIAEECEVVLGMEVLNRFETYLLNTCAEALEYVNEINHPNVGIMLDTFHMNIEEDDMADAIRMADKNLAHLHVGQQNRKVPGEGKIPWAEIGGALHDIDYNGPVVMEPFVIQGGQIGKDIKVWRDLVPDTSEDALDKDAKDALCYLRSQFEK
jgi:D-psicose/D-tagatose/L-ribulose 3-epimerase